MGGEGGVDVREEGQTENSGKGSENVDEVLVRGEGVLEGCVMSFISSKNGTRSAEGERTNK